MLSEELKKEILSMAENGEKESDICRKLNVSRGRVRRLISNEQTVVIRRLAKLLVTPSKNTKVGRCPTCGVKCVLPCKTCLLKQYSILLSNPQDESETQNNNDSIQMNNLNLKPGDQKRYEEIRQMRSN